ncbi:hypothetical protein LIER_12381 [Lithospermum erythrorhizon]|uniref:GRF-type domain-containing protein n=1 Tax=Lithospermum erythrorhizon TaxID=34254 RepID=A0AAV3PVM8_LITER
MTVDCNIEDRVVYYKYCGKLCVKLISTTKENPGRLFFGCPTPREKNDQIEELQLENDQLLKKLAVEKLKTKCLTKSLKGLIGAFVIFLLINWLYNGLNETNVFELPDV